MIPVFVALLSIVADDIVSDVNGVGELPADHIRGRALFGGFGGFGGSTRCTSSSDCGNTTYTVYQERWPRRSCQTIGTYTVPNECTLTGCQVPIFTWYLVTVCEDGCASDSRYHGETWGDQLCSEYDGSTCNIVAKNSSRCDLGTVRTIACTNPCPPCSRRRMEVELVVSTLYTMSNTTTIAFATSFAQSPVHVNSAEMLSVDSVDSVVSEVLQQNIWPMSFSLEQKKSSRLVEDDSQLSQMYIL